MALRRSLLLLVACLVIGGIAACGGSSKPPRPKHFKTPRFLLHAGLAFGAYHTFIFKPARAGQFSASASALKNAADATTFVSNELKLAARYAQRNPVEQALFPALTVMADKISALRAKILGPTSSLAEIEGINTGLGRINASAATGGHPIADASTAQIAAAGGPRA